MEISDYTALFHKALVHYEKRLRDLKENSKHEFDILHSDLDINADNIQAILADLDNKLNDEKEKIRKPICLALSVYILGSVKPTVDIMGVKSRLMEV